METIYLDYNATTPLDPAVREAMLPFLGEIWGNPSSVHRLGRHARSHLDAARERAAHVLGCKPAEIIFTSGGTESVNLAILGTARLLRSKGRHLITSAIEHHAVLHACRYLSRNEGFEVTLLPVSSEGRVSPQDLSRAVRPDTTLVSIMAANNEIGTLQPVSELGLICREKGVLFHTDAVQSLGKEPFTNIHQFNADLVSICGHKIYGPKGVGALFSKSPLHPDPILLGGSHENERRAGTENLAAIVGLVEALERFVQVPVFARDRLAPLSEHLSRTIDSLPDTKFVGSKTERLCNTVSFVTTSTDSIALLANLDLEGICASSGSACSAGSLEPSHVITALGLEPVLANSLVRFSLGRETTLSEIKRVENILPKIIGRSQHGQ
ncbi:MAG TPA: cysteine desulfurase family protein [Candidatus Limnocylindrales bacterium]|nr:cysteine desulfurase family protein [Candidatus Limnocylindrales bacterium]